MNVTSLLTRICNSLAKVGLSPTQEMTKYILACDQYATGEISGDELQFSICNYLDVYARRSRTISDVIHRIKEPSISELFTEATVMMVDGVLRSPDFRDLGLHVSSENNLKIEKGKYLKPDVAIWKDEKIISVIECKTSLGRARKEWQGMFEERVKILGSIGIREESIILFVASENCWQGFPSTDSRTLDTWFSLCPKGTWFGGGKQGEKKLSDLMNEGSLKKMIEKLHCLAQSA
jgi:hypothetical protein